MVVPGGRIIYITCSVLASEGPQLIKQFLANAPEIEIADIADIWAETIGKDGGGACPPIEDGLLQLLPGRDGTDGFLLPLCNQDCAKNSGWFVNSLADIRGIKTMSDSILIIDFGSQVTQLIARRLEGSGSLH